MDMDRTLEDVYKAAGKRLTDKMLKVIGEDYLPIWFYRPLRVLEDNSPDEMCRKKGKEKRKLRFLIDDILAKAKKGKK